MKKGAIRKEMISVTLLLHLGKLFICYTQTQAHTDFAGRQL